MSMIARVIEDGEGVAMYGKGNMRREHYGHVDEESCLLPSITLYVFPSSLESMKATLAVRESALSNVRIDVVDMYREVYTPRFIQLQPSCTVPVLVMPDGRVLRSSAEIVHFAHNSYPMYSHLGQEDNQELIREFCDLVALWDESNFSLGNPFASSREALIESSVVKRIRLGAVRRNLMQYGRTDPGLAKKYLQLIEQLQKQDTKWEKRVEITLLSAKTLEKILNRAEELLAKNQFLFGRNWTAADSMLVPVLHRTIEFGHTGDIKRRVNLLRYFTMVSGRPSFQKSMAPYNYKWMRRNLYVKFLFALLLQAIPYILIVLVCLLIVIYALHDNLVHLNLGGHVPVDPPSGTLLNNTSP